LDSKRGTVSLLWFVEKGKKSEEAEGGCRGEKEQPTREQGKRLGERRRRARFWSPTGGEVKGRKINGGGFI